jgi:ParB family chromosome partitioning protein
VPPDDAGTRYETICGNRRLLAARSLGLPKVPVRVREMDDDQAARFALWENLAREDLDPIDLAESIDGLRRIERLSWEEISDRFGFSRQWGWKQQKLAELPDEVKDMVRDRRLSPSKAMLLSQGTDNPAEMTQLAGGCGHAWVVPSRALRRDGRPA